MKPGALVHQPTLLTAMPVLAQLDRDPGGESTSVAQHGRHARDRQVLGLIEQQAHRLLLVRQILQVQSHALDTIVDISLLGDPVEIHSPPTPLRVRDHGTAAPE